ncbi:MAG: hypothetical protein ACYSSO_02125 [Planctomycetota bacterium]
MIIDGVNPGNGNAYGLQKVEPEVEETNQQPDINETVEPSNEDSLDDQEASGVIRLLQEGHFKGVADVRLRINFHDELAAIEAGELKNAAEGGINGVLEAVGGGAGLLMSGDAEGEGQGAAELQDEFAQAVTAVKDEFMSAERPSKDELIAGIQAAFEAFVEGLWELYPPAEEGVTETAEGEEEQGTEESGQEEGGDTEGYIAELKASFAAAMDELSAAMNGVYVLPELSEPMGNGVAYEKFLAIYNEMNGIEEGVSVEL